ncbi:MAG: cell wall hydrolase [archaeon]|nr:cell wall hydrolase [archaeon]MCR4323537.1 cell wall hydrolase [Nanoarchaeota archaeon]
MAKSGRIPVPLKVALYVGAIAGLSGGLYSQLDSIQQRRSNREATHYSGSAISGGSERPASPLERAVEGPVVETAPVVPERVNYRTEDFSEDTEQIALARMLYGEARGESNAENFAIAYSAINRSTDGHRWNGEGDLRAVVHAPWQYSCFNKGSETLAALKDPESDDSVRWFELLDIAGRAIAGEHPELNCGQTHYFNPRRANPDWADDLELIEFGGRNFAHTYRRED